VRNASPVGASPFPAIERQTSYCHRLGRVGAGFRQMIRHCCRSSPDNPCETESNFWLSSPHAPPASASYRLLLSINDSRKSDVCKLKIPSLVKESTSQEFSSASRRLDRVLSYFPPARARKFCDFLPIEMLLPPSRSAVMSVTDSANQNDFGAPWVGFPDFAPESRLMDATSTSLATSPRLSGKGTGCAPRQRETRMSIWRF